MRLTIAVGALLSICWGVLFMVGVLSAGLCGMEVLLQSEQGSACHFIISLSDALFDWSDHP